MFELPAIYRDAIARQALAERPNECCGVLLGRNGRAQVLVPVRNEDQSYKTYRFDRRDQVALTNGADRMGLDVTVVYHSHTHTEAYPSATDVALAVYPDARYIIVSLRKVQDGGEPEFRCFRILDVPDAPPPAPGEAPVREVIEEELVIV